MRLVREREGSALIIVVIVMFMLGMLAVVTTQISTTRSNVALERRLTAEALGAAEAAVAMQLNDIVSTNGTSLADADAADGAVDGRFTLTYTLPGGRSATVTVTDLGANGVDDGGGGDGLESGIVRVVATGVVPHGNQVRRRTVETYMSATLHPLFYKATYVGNHSTPGLGYVLPLGPGNLAPRTITPPPPVTQPNWDTAAKTTGADYIEGDVHVNGGSVQITGNTNVFGTVDAESTVSGDPVGTANDGADPIPPPDLNSINYDSIADLVINLNGSNQIVKSGPLAGNSPNVFQPSLSASDYRFGSVQTFDDHDRPYIHFGPPNGANGGTIPLDSRLDGKLVVVKGNLWLHDTSQFVLNFPNSGNGVHLTIVVEGNLYISDDLNYRRALDGVLIIAKQVPGTESYTDLNGDHVRQANEPIINDDGDGVYEGPREGSGNVYFGDPRFGTGGVTDGYIYAENNAYLTSMNPNVDPPSGQDAVYGVFGFMSAGNQLILGNRTSGSNYVNFRVKYDPRIENGTLSFKGAPKPFGGNFEGLRVLSWRELPPGSN